MSQKPVCTVNGVVCWRKTKCHDHVTADRVRRWLLAVWKTGVQTNSRNRQRRREGRGQRGEGGEATGGWTCSHPLSLLKTASLAFPKNRSLCFPRLQAFWGNKFFEKGKLCWKLNFTCFVTAREREKKKKLKKSKPVLLKFEDVSLNS